MPHLSGNSISIFRRTILLSGGRGFWFNPKSIQCHTLRVKSFTSLMVDLRQSKCFVKTPKWYEERRRSSVKENKWLGHKIVCNPTFNLFSWILYIFRMSKYISICSKKHLVNQIWYIITLHLVKIIGTIRLRRCNFCKVFVTWFYRHVLICPPVGLI